MLCCAAFISEVGLGFVIGIGVGVGLNAVSNKFPRAFSATEIVFSVVS